MNVKFTATELTCLLGEDYDRIYSTLKRNLGSTADLFAERLIGHGYLQWRLPGEGWESLAKCDPSLRTAVDQKVRELKEQIGGKFGANRGMAANILTTPDESFIYFRKDGLGKIAVCLVAWGYRYPERVNTSDLRRSTTPKGATEKVTITLLRDGQPVGNYPFELNGYQRKTEANGSFPVGHVEVGRKFRVAVDDVVNEYTVTQGGGDIRIYLASLHGKEGFSTELFRPNEDKEDSIPDNLPTTGEDKADNPAEVTQKEDKQPGEDTGLSEETTEEETTEEETTEEEENLSNGQPLREKKSEDKKIDSKKDKKERDQDQEGGKKGSNPFGLLGILPMLCLLAMIILAYITGLKLI